MDAVREQCLSDGAAPAPGGWEAVGAKMRRAAARRRAMLAAAVALPAGALILWAPWRETVPPSSPVAQVSAPAPSAVIPDSPAVIPASPAVIPDRFSVISEPIGDPASPDGASGLVPKEHAPAHQEEPVSPPSPEQVPNKEEPVEIVLPSPRHRARISSVSLRAGSATVRRNAPISMMSAPYLAALNFLNTTDPSLTPRVKSNTSNTHGISAAANAFFPESSAGQYTHDLPLSLGLALRMDLTPRLGLETGLEYTYLHSMEEFAGSRLNQRLHFVGIPVRVDASMGMNGGFGFYAGIGGKVEKCVSATLGRVACEEPRLQWSAEAFGGIQYQISSRMHLYFQPALTWYLTKTDLPTYRTENPLGFSLHAGLRFDL